MDRTNFTPLVKGNDFSVREFIFMGNKYYAVIHPKGTTYWVRISQQDYYKGLKAYYSSKSVQCYPIEGTLNNDVFEDVKYELVIK